MQNKINDLHLTLDAIEDCKNEILEAIFISVSGQCESKLNLNAKGTTEGTQKCFIFDTSLSPTEDLTVFAIFKEKKLGKFKFEDTDFEDGNFTSEVKDFIINFLKSTILKQTLDDALDMNLYDNGINIVDDTAVFDFVNSKLNLFGLNCHIVEDLTTVNISVWQNKPYRILTSSQLNSPICNIPNEVRSRNIIDAATLSLFGLFGNKELIVVDNA